MRRNFGRRLGLRSPLVVTAWSFRPRNIPLSFAFLTWIIVFVIPIACAQEVLPLPQLQHKIWTVADGAPLHLLEVVQGSDGVLWMSATDGLYRFDGLKFTRYELPIGSTPTRNNNYSLYESKSGALWAASWYEGVVRIEGDKVRAYGTQDGLPAKAAVSVIEDRDHTMWCTAGGQLLHLSGDRWIDEPPDSGLPAGVARLDLFDHAGTQWVATTTSKLFFRPRGQRKFEQASDSWPDGYEDLQLLESPAGELWIALVNYGKQQSMVRQLGTSGHESIANNEFQFPFNIWDARFDSAGSLWVTGSGISRISFNYQKSGAGLIATEAREETLPPENFSSGETHAIAEDNEGDIWVTTGSSLDRFRIPSLIAIGPPAKSVATGQDVAAASNGNVWIRSTANARLLSYQGNRILSEGPSPDACFNLFEDKSGVVWFNTLSGLFRFDHDRLQQVAIPKDLSAVRIRQIMQRADGSMLFSFKDLGLWKLDQGHWSPLSLPNLPKEQLSVIYLDSRDNLWLGFITGKIVLLAAGRAREVPLADLTGLGIIYAFLETKDGLLVSGNDGVAVLRGGRFERLKLDPDLEINGISGMIESLDGDLWLNTGQGVVHISRSELKGALASPRNRSMQGELFSEVTIHGPGRLLFDLPTIARDGTGELWFNTSDVIAYIDPDHIVRNRIAPILKIVSATADGSPLDQRFRVPAGSRTLRVEYFGSNLTAPEKVRYKYKLDGVDEDWQDVGHRTEAVYTRLRPGYYSFHVLATNGEGVWSQPIGLSIRVLPVFYQTTWFLALCCFAAIVLVVLVFRLRLNSLARTLRDRAEERANERIRIARDLHDTLLQGFQGLMLSFHVAVQAVPKDTRARELLEASLTKADRLVREGRDRVSRLRSESLEGVSLPEALKALGDELNTDHTLRFEVRITQTEIEIKPHVKDELFCIAREAVTNSFHHGGATTIGAALDYGKRALTMICYDDGCGIAPDIIESAPRLHYGMVGMQERARKIGATYSCESTPDKGTKVIVGIPASRVYVRPTWITGVFRSFRSADSTEA
jgi:signal transduction histidine kinase/ligand-binding sensor domain-containing protein